MSDKRNDQGGMEPDEMVRGKGGFADVDDTEGQAVRGRPFAETDPDAADTEGQSVRGRPLAGDFDAQDTEGQIVRPGRLTDDPGADDTEGHAGKLRP